ncbi:SusC/RagA family TonB-linked outer membrane protein [Marivirga lumbricoides]|uniref:SusC/RagA family TonB-linked outer membrane protein n=1 Tax=Marivirga lumbricoides TaxID=1046115 RepID=A0ABQ1L7G1_9BACT|nr:SusC/RagA family TonB-linked outer membrane protein [Marivirga lumbricoides]
MLFYFLLVENSIAFSQEFKQTTVTGTVTDSEGLPLPGVTVLEKGTSNGAHTDIDGKYALIVTSEGAVLRFSFVGMATTEREVGRTTTIDVQMEEDLESLNEVVVVGYGTQVKRSVTTAVSKVSEEDFNQGVVTNALSLIQGKVPGLSITRSGGNNPNGGTSIQLRGVTSITGNTEPLIVIDGIPGGNLDLVQQNDIESFDVLKSGAAAAIYGTRGNNGVILITTKKGKAGITTFNYSTYISRDYVSAKPEFLSASQFRGAIADGLISANDFGHSTDIYDELVDESNLSQYHNFAASGGSEKTNYRVSLYYRDLEGVALENGREEYGIRASFNQTGFNDKFNIQSSIATNFSDANLLGGGYLNKDNQLVGGQFGIVTDWNPTAPIYAPYSTDEGTDLYNEGKFGFYQPQNGYNPFSEYKNRINERQQSTFSWDAKIGYELVEGLIISAFGSYQRNMRNERQYRSTEDWAQYNEGSSYRGTGYAYKFNRLQYTQTFEPTITYEKKISNHSLNFLGGYSYQYSTLEDFEMSNSGFTTDAFKDWNIGAGNAITDTDLPRPTMESFKDDNTLIAIFSRVTYSFMERYFFQASIRREGSSKFGANNKWGNFPAISGAWMISDENFMENVNLFTTLKLRADYGITGNQGIPNYQSLVTLGTGGRYPIFPATPNGDGEYIPTYYQTYGANKNPNPDLRWERKKEWNIGVDFGLIGNRLSGSLDVYNRKTEDLLLSYSVSQPPYVQGSIYTNVGTITNNGVELGMSFRAINTGDFSWTIDVAANYQQNEITTLSNDVYIVSELFGGNIGNPGNLGDAIRNTEGGPIGNFYGKRFAGFTDDGEWLFYKEDGSTGRTDEMVSEDSEIIGNGMPKYNASLTNTFRYKNFDLTVFFRGKFDYDILNTVDMFYGNPNIGGNILSSALGKYSHITEAPQYSDYYLEKGDFVKLDNLTLGYNFNFTGRKVINALRVYVNARNLATITGYSGRDPEVSDTGLYPGIDDRNFYPRTTTLTAGINVKF